MMTTPIEETLGTDAVGDWLAQFPEQERGLVTKLLPHFAYYGPGRINESLRALHKKIMALLQLPDSSIWFVPVGYVAKSGSVIAYFYKTQNDIAQERFVLATDLPRLKFKKQSAVVFLDDYVGTGHQARQVWDTVMSVSPRATEQCRFVFAAIVGTRSGIRHLEENTGFTVAVVDTIEESALPFSDGSRVFPQHEERQQARAVLAEYGARLYPQAPLGYENAQGLLGFFYSTPNNTLPIFWSTQDGWKPLLPHKESYRDPSSLVGPASGVVSDFGPNRPLLETSQVEAADINKDMLIKLLTEFQRLDILLAVAPIIRTFDISEATLSALLHLLPTLRQLKHEHDNVCTALLVVPLGAPSDSLGKLQIQANGNSAINDMDTVVKLAQLIDGLQGCVVADSAGTVLGVASYRRATEASYLLLPDRYHRAVRASLESRGWLFLFLGDGRATVFLRGNRLLVYRGASWHLQPADLEGGIRRLAVRYDVDQVACEHVFRLALRLSDEGHGALITVGDHERVMSLASDLESKLLRLSSMHVVESETESLIGLMRQDGATIISASGEVTRVMVQLRPPADARGVELPGKGTKHKTAAQISSSARCFAIAVSVDGQVTVFGDGEVLFKLMG